jgi:hypothetical protein
VGRNAQRRRSVGSDWTDRLKEQQATQQSRIVAPGGGPKPPFCPLLSQFIVAGASPVVLAGGQQANQLNMELLRVPCMLGPDCMLYDAEWKPCGLVSQLQMISDLVAEEDNDGQQVPGANDPGTLPAGDSPGGGGPAGTP